MPDLKIELPTDAIVRITSTAICGSDLQLYELLGPFMSKRDIMGHEPMGIVEEVGALAALYLAIDLVRRGGTISVIGVYGGMTDPLPMLTRFDKQIQLRMGQANVRRWVDDLLPFVTDDADPLGVEGFATHHLPLDQAPQAYEMFPEEAGRHGQDRPEGLTNRKPGA